MDKILIYDKTFNPLNSNFRVEIIPRRYVYIVTIDIREPFSNTIQKLTSNVLVHNSLLNVDLTGFIAVNDTRYELTVMDAFGDVLWFGGCMYSTKNIQNYQLNNSDENNLKF